MDAPGGEEDRLEALALEVRQGEVAAHRGVELQLDAQAEDPLDLLLEDLARQPVLGDADGHHAAGDRHRLEDGDRVAEAGEVVGGRHAGRPAAHDRDLLGTADRGRDGRQLAVLGREALEGPDRDRLVQDPRRQATSHGAVQIQPHTDGNGLTSAATA